LTTRAWLAALALCAGGGVITGSAGNLSFLEASPLAYFKPEDYDLMRENALKLLDATGAQKKQSWSNTNTGASGWAQVRGQFTASDGAPCKRLRVVNKAGGLQSDATYTVCKYADRGWVIHTDATPAH
jgi:hypothetical protein